MHEHSTTADRSNSSPETQLSTILAQAQAARVTLDGDGSPTAQHSAAAFDFSQFQTDAGNAQRFAAQHAGSLRYTQAHGWLVWDGKRWKADETGEVMRAARRTVAAMMEDAQAANGAATRFLEALAKRMAAGEEVGDENAAVKAAQKRARELQAWAFKSQGRERLKAMIDLAQSEPKIAAHAADFDRDPWLLNCQNGILDLRTGKLSPHEPGAMMTQLAGASYIPNAPCRTWLSFLERVQPDPEMRTFLQRSIGYALTGNTPEQVFWDFYGTGANGKSVLSGIVLALFGDYGMRAKAQTFMASGQVQNGSGASEDVATLAGKRLVLASELEDSQQLAESFVKDLTGGDKLRARFLHKNSFEFQPVCKLWLVGNYKPVVKGTDLGIWRRVRLVPFAVTIPDAERDAGLTDKLLAELDGILAWAVQGCSDWQRDGLATPKAVQDATQAYRDDSDLVGQWLTECTKETPTGKAPAKALFQSYKDWCAANGLRAMTKIALGRAMAQRGLKSGHDMTGNFWLGMEIIPDETQPELMPDSTQKARDL